MAARARLDQARNQTGYAKFIADRAGVVTAVPGEVGTVVEVGEPVIHLALSDEKEIRLTVPEQEVALLEQAAAVRVAFWALPGVELDGTLREIAASADPLSRTFAVRVAIAEPPASVRLGMSAGEPVVAAGGALLNEGQAVVVTGETAALPEALP